MRHKRMMKIFWIILGFVCFGTGTLGVVLPVLPTVPFYMGTAFCFAKSSEKLYAWFKRQRFIKNTWKVLWRSAPCQQGQKSAFSELLLR